MCTHVCEFEGDFACVRKGGGPGGKREGESWSSVFLCFVCIYCLRVRMCVCMYKRVRVGCSSV